MKDLILETAVRLSENGKIEDANTLVSLANHSFRHGFIDQITHYQDVAPALIQKLARHRDLATTTAYTYPEIDRLEGVIGRMKLPKVG